MVVYSVTLQCCMSTVQTLHALLIPAVSWSLFLCMKSNETSWTSSGTANLDPVHQTKEASLHKQTVN